MSDSPTATAKPKMALWKKLLIGVGVFFVAMVVLGLIVGEDTAEDEGKGTSTQPTTSAVETTEPSTPLQPEPEAVEEEVGSDSPTTEAPAEPEGSTDEDIAREAEAYVKTNWGMGADQSWQSFECTAGINCWQPYVVEFTFANGILRPTLQIDRSTQKTLGEKAAENMASFISFSDEPWAQKVDWVEVMDGAGVHVSQESVKRR